MIMQCDAKIERYEQIMVEDETFFEELACICDELEGV
jgi:hypothetical protein